MFSILSTVNVLKYIVPCFLGFLLGFYLAEHVTTKVHTTRINELKNDCAQVQSKLATVIDSQNTTASILNSTSAALAQMSADSVTKDKVTDQKALIKYRDKIVIVKDSCKLSEPGLDYIKEHVTGN